MDEKVEKGQASLYVDITCPICQRAVAMSNTVELAPGIRLCFTCHTIPREYRTEVLLLRLLTQKEEKGGRFRGQVVAAKNRSEILSTLTTIETLVGNIDVRISTGVDNGIIPKMIDSIIREINFIRTKLKVV